MRFSGPIVFLCLLTSGCATNQLQITYLSDPPGAVFYDESGQKYGYTPQTAYYNLSENDKRRGIVKVRGTSVQWVSGASSRVNELTVDLRRGLNHTFTFKRPKDATGLEADMRFALELEKLEIMRRQAVANENAAYEAFRARRAAEEARDAAQSSSQNSVWVDTGKSLKRCTSIGPMVDCF